MNSGGVHGRPERETVIEKSIKVSIFLLEVLILSALLSPSCRESRKENVFSNLSKATFDRLFACLRATRGQAVENGFTKFDGLKRSDKKF